MQVTLRVPDVIVNRIDSSLDHLVGETRSDFMRLAAIERLEKLGLSVRE